MSSDEAELQAQQDQADLEARAKKAFPDLTFDETDTERHTPPPKRQPRSPRAAHASQRSKSRRRSSGSTARSTPRSTGGAIPKKTTYDRPPTSKQTMASTSGTASGKSRARSPQTPTAGKRQRTDSNTTAPKPKTILLDNYPDFVRTWTCLKCRLPVNI